jgi:hypothetical protein
VSVEINLSRTESFAISFRVPGWCASPSLTVNGEVISLNADKGYAKVEREWHDGDRIVLRLPMEVRTSSRNLYAISVERGPLVYALPVQENWQMITKREKFHDWEIYPSSPWKYGLLANTEYEVILSEIPYQPFDVENSPVRLKAKGQLVRDWKMEGNNAGVPPLHPKTDGQPIAELKLVPYGSAKLRIGEFPLIGGKNKARDNLG